MRLTTDVILIAIALVLVLWYLALSIYNRRRGITVYRWLQSGLKELGGEVSGRWLGSSGSGAQMHVDQAGAPFRELDAIYLLASRELLPLFLLDLARGKRDRLIFKAALRRVPPSDLEIVRARSRAARGVRSDEWQVEDGPHGLVIGQRGRGAGALRAASTPLLEKYGPRIQQISWSRQAPHLIVVLSLAGLYEPGGSAAALFADLAAAASAAQE